MLLLLASVTVHAAVRLTVMVKPLDRSEPCWWEAGSRGEVGGLHTTLSAALSEQGFFVVGPLDAAELALPQRAGPPRDEEALALGRRAGASMTLVGTLRASPLEPIPLLGVQGTEVELAARLLTRVEEQPTEHRVSARAYEADAETARRRAVELAARRLASRLWASLPQDQGERVAAASETRVRVRGLSRWSELRQVVQRLQERQAGTFWIAGARQGEAQLAGRSSARGVAGIVAALDAEPFPDFTCRVTQETAGLVVEVEPLPAVPGPLDGNVAPPGGPPAAPGLQQRLPGP